MTAVFITGGARRIGRSIALFLAQQGLDVALHYHRSEQEARQTQADIVALNRRCVLVQANLEDVAILPEAMKQAQAQLGSIDILVNNASRFNSDDSLTATANDFLNHYTINTVAPLILTQAFVNGLTAPSGLVINLIDERVLALNPRYFSYTLSKSALWTATQTLAQSLAPRVRVNGLAPGPTFANVRQNPDDFFRQAAATPLQKAVDASEFGRMIMALWHCPSITGQLIALDSGQHLAWETPDFLAARE